MNKEALEILVKIKENINDCCAISMDPDNVLDLIQELENILNQDTDDE